MNEFVTKFRRGTTVALLALFVLALSACGGSEPTAAPTEAPAAAAVEPTEAPQAEPTATSEPEAEPTATAAAEEEAAPTATAVAEEAMPAPAITGDPINGQYIATLTGGCGCHMNRDIGALAGGNKFEGGFGVVYASNLTPDQATGIGSYTEEGLMHVLRTGARPDGSVLAPAMPYRTFSILNDKDARDVASYLLSLEPVSNQVGAPELTAELVAYTPDVEPAAEPSSDPVVRGEELVTIARCGSCHTPNNEDGSVNMDKMLAGATVRDSIAANITPDMETGIGAWSQEEIATLLRAGTRPDGSQVEGAMAQQVDRRFSTLTESDALAMAAYLQSIPAVSNDPFAK